MATDKHKFYPPLPPGWEARWDPNQKAFFYIDHKTKTTSWEDPRFTKKQELATHFTPDSQSHDGGHGESIPLRDISHSANRSPHHRSPTSQRSHSPLPLETTFSSHHIDAMVTRLKGRFPGAMQALIRDILNMSNNDEDEAARQLMDLGFESASTPAHSTHTSPAHASGRTSSTASPARKSSGPTPSHKLQQRQQQPKQSPPKKPQLSDAQKRELKVKLCVEFKDLETEVVQMALEACEYDADIVRAALGRVTNNWRCGAGSSSSHATTAEASRPAPSQRTTSPTHFTSAACLEPVVFGDDDSLKSSGSAKSKPQGSPAIKPSPHRQTQPQPQQQRQQHRAKQVTRSAVPSTSTTTASKVVTDQPRSMASHVSQPDANHHDISRSLARGPDSTLCVGPNSEMRTGPDPSYLQGPSVEVYGPNPELCQGRVADLAHGSRGAIGPNPTLRCGHESPAVLTTTQMFIQSHV